MPPRPPARRPGRPFFGSGPTAKRPGWSIEALSAALVGRSHRSASAKERLEQVIRRSRDLLGIPDGHRLAIVPASDTGAFEMAMWNLLGSRGVDLIAFESFGQGWVTDVVGELRLADVRTLSADYGALPDLALVDPGRDVVFTWNGTTSGVRVPDAAWISDARSGLTLCDATSAVFAMELPWAKLDVITWSWQKVLGGEAQHGMLALGPRAVERLLEGPPERPLPKIFRLTKKGRLIEGLFRGETINTPSMLAVEDALDGLRWAKERGGLPALVRRSEQNLRVVEAWVERTPWVDFLASDPATRSSTSICLKLADPRLQGAPVDVQRALIKRMVQMLEREGVAYDIAAYRDAPPGLRLWGGATVEADDLEALLPWLDWAFETALGSEGDDR